MKRLLVIVLVFGSLPVAPAWADLEEGLKHCAAITSDVEMNAQRLACYDKLARGLYSPWQVFTETFARERYPRVYLWSRANSVWVRSKTLTGTDGVTKIQPSLWIQCVKGKTSALIDWDINLNMSKVTVKFKLDNDPVKERVARVSRDKKKTGQWKSELAINAIRSAFGKKTMIVRILPARENPITVKFDISKLKEAIKPVREYCIW